MSEPQKVYLATRGSYSDYQLLHAFARREDAEAYHLTEDVEECEVLTGPIEARTLYKIGWVPDEPDRAAAAHQIGNPHFWDYLEDFTDRPVSFQWGQFRSQPRLVVEGFDAAEVQRVYEEHRAQHVATPARLR